MLLETVQIDILSYSRKYIGHKLDYSTMCTQGYTRWPTPSIKVAPSHQPWPYADEEAKWNSAVREIREQRAHAVKLLRPLRYYFLNGDKSLLIGLNRAAKGNQQLMASGRNLFGFNPCQLMDEFGVSDGFQKFSNVSELDAQITKTRLDAWEKETGLKFDEDFRLPEPHLVFKCNNGTMSSFNDALLAGLRTPHKLS